MYLAIHHDQPIGYTRGNSEFTAYMLRVVLAHLSFKKKKKKEQKGIIRRGMCGFMWRTRKQ